MQPSEIIGEKFGFLTVLEKDNNYKKNNNIKSGKAYYKCSCVCGSIVTVRVDCLLTGATKSCGCKTKELKREKQMKDITGKRFGKLVALNPDYTYAQEKGLKNSGQVIYWRCKCDCGFIGSYPGNDLRSGKQINCPRCSSSKGEVKIRELLRINRINYEEQKSYNTCRFPETGALLRFDFYINNSFLLEYDGILHFEEGQKNVGWNNSEHFEKQKQRDLYKNQWCKDNGMQLKRIPYWDLEILTIEDIMGNKYLI